MRAFPNGCAPVGRAASGIAAFHADKHIGDLLSDPDELSLSAALALFEKNCEYAAAFGADRVIVHCWGVPDSDKNAPMLYERIGLMLEIAAQYSVEMLIEGIFCTQKSPLFHMKKLAVMYDTLGFTLDTRCAQFHRELYTMLDDKELWPDRIRHVHIGDYSGGRCDWSKIYPIYQPGAGDINWLLVFDRLRANGYTGALTLEAPGRACQGRGRRAAEYQPRLSPRGDGRPARRAAAGQGRTAP